MKLILFEFKKIIRSKVFLIFLLITFLFISAIFFRNVVQQDRIQAKKIEYFSRQSSNVFNQNEADRQALLRGQNPESEARLQVGNPLYSKLKELIVAIEEDNWQEELKLEIDVYQLAMEFHKVKGGFPLSEKDMLDRIKLNEILIKQNLPKEDFDLSIQPTIFMKKIVTMVLNVVGFLLLLLILGTQITKEFEDHSMKLVYALPVSRTFYVSTKFISLYITSIIWLTLVLFASYILPTLFGKSTGDIYSYPLFTESGEIISSGFYLKETILLSLCFLAFAVSVLILLGFFIRNTLITYIVVFCLFLSGTIALNNGMYNRFNPFLFENIDDSILKLQLSLKKKLVLIGYSVSLLLISLGMNRKRGM